MARIRLRVILLAGLVLASAEVVLGQVATGTPPFGSFGGGPFDTVNLATLNVYFRDCESGAWHTFPPFVGLQQLGVDSCRR